MIKKYLITIITSIFIMNFSISFGDTGDVISENIDLNSAGSDSGTSFSGDSIINSSNKDNSIDNDGNIINDTITKKREAINSILDSTKEEKDIKAIENTLKEVQIKKDLNEEFLNTIKNQVNDIKEKMLENQDNIKKMEEDYKNSSEMKIKLNELEKQNQSFRNQILFKEMLIKDLTENIKGAELLAEKYNNLLDKYTGIKKQVDDNSDKETKEKMKILYLFLIISFIIYLFKIALYKKLGKNYEKEFLYFDLIFAIIFIVFLISFFFYLYTQLYALLFFISGYLVVINAPIISSFIGSFIIFRKYSIGDIIKQGDDKGKIVKITPIYTTIRTINDDGVITDHNVNIPNNILVRGKVDVISNPKIGDHNFHIILNLVEIENIFKFIDEISNNIILKTLTNKLKSIDSLDEDIFKITYDQIDFDKVKINFFWRATSLISRKLERKILGYVKYQLDLVNIKKDENGKNIKKEEEK